MNGPYRLKIFKTTSQVSPFDIARSPFRGSTQSTNSASRNFFPWSFNKSELMPQR
jgi:hypothetical protein